jgi:uncharacterized RDD family membrane protein YckC
MGRAGAPPTARTPPHAETASPPLTPGLMRRLACFVYEGVLLFGVVMAAGLAYGVAFGQRDAMLGRAGLQALLFIVLGAYFTWFWSHGGQTLAMKTWRIRLVQSDGKPAPPLRCTLRWLLAWAWFAPALLALWLAGNPRGWTVAAALSAGVAGYALLARLRADRQFWHDAVCGTRLVDWQTSPRAKPRERP